MSNRTDLQLLLESILGSNRVYYQPPATVKITYPAIIYSLSNIRDFDANNKPYVHNKAYKITVIDKNPDSSIPDKLLDLPKCSFNNSFTSDNLNHFVYTLYI